MSGFCRESLIKLVRKIDHFSAGQKKEDKNLTTKAAAFETLLLSIGLQFGSNEHLEKFKKENKQLNQMFPSHTWLRVIAFANYC